eukprot:CAMPEP_0203903684 /NCGR_PEP_ID=MMETSP0359-20131031/45597_1 /ASSEMBLY_ACC=CAM_ASM_000338 /TAXON_ID=268821 /ORGANISM="Scrippsiella Hangoei, Strain SHTV-5" /LENGTH=308 /DNA_ID=CAMNT_0050827777 /DNA_START=19 /DNA_END=941 /DNA_ORIENTATION=+
MERIGVQRKVPRRESDAAPLVCAAADADGSDLWAEFQRRRQAENAQKQSARLGIQEILERVRREREQQQSQSHGHELAVLDAQPSADVQNQVRPALSDKPSGRHGSPLALSMQPPPVDASALALVSRPRSPCRAPLPSPQEPEEGIEFDPGRIHQLPRGIGNFQEQQWAAGLRLSPSPPRAGSPQRRWLNPGRVRYPNGPPTLQQAGETQSRAAPRQRSPDPSPSDLAPVLRAARSPSPPRDLGGRTAATVPVGKEFPHSGTMRSSLGGRPSQPEKFAAKGQHARQQKSPPPKSSNRSPARNPQRSTG